MQYLPDVFSGNSTSAMGGVSLSSAGSGAVPAGSGNAFLESLNKELASAGVTPVMDVSLGGQLPVGFRTIKNDQSSVLESEDVTNILTKLKKRGVKDSALRDIEDILASGQVPTLGTILGSVGKNGRTSDDLTDEERSLVLGALQKMQFSQEDIEAIEGLMDEGKGYEALKRITKGLENAGSDLALSKGEMKALLRGLDLPETTLNQLAARVGEGPEEGFGKNAIAKLLAPAMQELTEMKQADEAMAKELRAAIDEALREKKTRQANETVADARGSKRADRAETRMRDDLTAKANGFGEGRESALSRLEEEEMRRGSYDEEDAAKQFAREKKRWAGEGDSSSSDKRTVSARVDSADGQTASASRGTEAFNAFTQRLDAAAGMAVPGQTDSTGLAGQTQSAAKNADAAFAHRQEIFSQVEQGMLRQFQNGTSQMTLRLDPVELGQISVMLTVKGGEVRARIQAENPETTAAISEQMAQLKASLEEQGLKVAEISVETRTPQDMASQDWSGMANFNKEQEMREQARFLQLAKMRREAGEQAGKGLARDMQGNGARADYAASGLHIIA